MKTVVIAQYQEDISWINDIPNEWKTWVITKNKDIPNIGREPATFLWAINNIYKNINLKDEFIFVQGNPFDHYPNLMKIFDEEQTGYKGLSTFLATTDQNGGPYHYSLPVEEKLKKWLNIDWSFDITFASGGQFSVTGKEILKYPKSFYDMLYEESCEDPKNPYVLERLWPVIFKQ